MSEINTKTLLLNTISAKLREHPSYKNLQTALQKKGKSTLQVVQGGFLHMLLATLYKETKARVMVVFPSEQDAAACANDLAGWNIASTIFPWWQGYRPLPVADSIFGERSSALHHIASSEQTLVLTSIRAFLTAVPPEHYIQKQQIIIKKGASIDPIRVAEHLSLFGYQRVSKVHLHGEFALRGEVLDVFLSGAEMPTRIALDYSKVAEIRSIDPITQRSDKYYTSVVLYPACEIVWDEPSFAALRKSYSQFKQYASSLSYEEIELGKHVKGEEFFYPYVFPGSYPADYLHKKNGDLLLFIDYEKLQEGEYAFRSEYEKMVETLPQYAKNHAVLETYQERANIFMHSSAIGKEKRDKALDFNIKENISFYGNMDLFRDETTRHKEGGDAIIVCAGNELQSRRIKTVLHDEEISVLPEGISSGFSAPDLGLLVVAERELFGRKQTQALRSAQSESIRSVTELEVGDYVVHVMHGIGLFKGITRMKVRENERDYIYLEYADEEFLYVPIEQTNMVQKYVGHGDTKVKLSSLGTKAWSQKKARVKAQVEELASSLLRLYSHRQIVSGFAFASDSEWQLQFEAAFPYTETADQLKCIADVKADMESDKPMDRLICGDVGFGKTEIAIRAAFKAVINGKQVAILAPTTILVEQHYERIIERMDTFPVKVEMLSRFVSRDKQRSVIIGLREGTVDLVIGTHRLLEPDVGFKDLGLIVLDEEQRFGVKAKERLKEVKASIDCITMTATPIPRTLHMSLLKLRTVSFIQTPPVNRKSIHTIVDTFDESLIASAIRFELERGGQVYYMHNRVETIEEVRYFIEALVPEATVEVIHGQMHASTLEDRIHRFMHKSSNVLITTTIIENGIDIPNANTIIIERADQYGVAQLYQLRGRVGRSERQSYAYLLYPDAETLSDTARKRLEIIADNTELGAGFQVALKDMEVRGTGNLLGKQQSGNIIAVGFDLYIQLLQEAIDEVHDEKVPTFDVQLELEYSGFIPDTYIPDPAQKIDMYRNIASVNKPDELVHLRAEMHDRFGQMPKEVHSLLALSDIRILCNSLSIRSIRERKNIARIEFGNVAVVSAEKIAKLIQMYDSISLDPDKPNILIVRTRNMELKEKSQYISDILKQIL